MPGIAEIAVVDLFCGAGGLSLGLNWSGLRIAGGIDIDPHCRFPFEANIKAPFLNRDVTKVKPKEISALFGDAKIRVLAACAPCQPFSGYTTKRSDMDERWKLLFEILRFSRLLQPEIVTVENVARLAKRAIWREFVHSLEILGYYVSWDVVDASNFDVPQRRRRVVLLASRLGRIDLPRPTSAKGPPDVRSAIAKLPPVGCGERNPKDPLHCARSLGDANLKRIRASKPAGTWRQWPKALLAKCHQRKSGKTYPSVYGRMSWTEPAPTITTQFYGFGNGRFGHPEQDRAITLREGAILQSFPAKFAFAPKVDRVNFNKVGKLIGNAVPPKLAKAIGRAIIDHAATIVGGTSRNS